MGLVGILLGLALLIGFAYRGWSVLLLAPAAALVAALFAGEPLLAHWTQTFMTGTVGFVAQFFPIFLLGALFGKLMEDSGSVQSVARFMGERLGARRAILAVVLAGAMVTYGGVSLFVAFFVLVPMAQTLFRDANIPRRLIPAAIALGTSTFTMTALPGTPAVQNAIPMPFFGTTPFAAPGLGLIAAAIMLLFGLWWLGRGEASARRGGIGYESARGRDPGSGRDRRGRGSAGARARHRRRELRPARGSAGPGQPGFAPGLRRLSAFAGGRHGQSGDELSGSAQPGSELSRRRALGSDLAVGRRRDLVGDRRPAGRDPDTAGAQLEASDPAARDRGRRSQRLGPAGDQRRLSRRIRYRGRRHAGLRAGARLGARDRGRSSGLARGLHERPGRAHRLGLRRTDHCAGGPGSDLHAARRRASGSTRR